MNEVKTPKKPLIVYYAIAILVVLLINTLLVPMVSQARVKYVDYGTFIQMTEEDKISEVQVQDNQIVFITKEDEANKNAVYYRTGKMDDPELTSRLSEHGVRFDKEIVEETSPLLSFLLSFVFPIVLFIALGQLLTRQLMKRMGGGKDAMSFGMGNSNAKVYVKDSAGSIKFDDVAGEALLAPMPTNISTNSEPEMEKNGTFASPATALASMVLPVPGGPTSRMPLGIDAPIS